MTACSSSCSGVAMGWTGVDMSTPLLLEVAAEIDTNPISFYRGRGSGGGWSGRLRLQTAVRSSALTMSVHPTYFDLATPLSSCHFLLDAASVSRRSQLQQVPVIRYVTGAWVSRLPIFHGCRMTTTTDVQVTTNRRQKTLKHFAVNLL